jgi:hypothetical protein
VKLAHVLADGAARHPERTALLFEGERISYRDLPKSAMGKILKRSIDLCSLRERVPRRPAP